MFKLIGKKTFTVLRISKTVLHDLSFNYNLIQNCSTMDGLLKLFILQLFACQYFLFFKDAFPRSADE